MSAGMAAWAAETLGQVAPLLAVVVDLPHGPQSCCCDDPIPGVAAPMNCEFGIQACGDCELYDSDLTAAWALAQHVPGAEVVFIRWTGDDDDPEGPVVTGWTPATNTPTDIIATGTDPWIERDGHAINWVESDLWVGKIVTSTP